MEGAAAADTSVPSATETTDGSPSTEPGDSKTHERDTSRFECNICLDAAHDAVISLCGHLFCLSWPCLHQWLETRPNRQVCPVCKSAISRDKVIPLYGRGGAQTDPRDAVPPRPQGRRSEPTTGFPGFNWGGAADGGVQFSFGIGAFPFTLFASTLNFGDRRPAPPHAGSRQHDDEQFISKLFIWVAVIFMVWLLMA